LRLLFWIEIEPHNKEVLQSTKEDDMSIARQETEIAVLVGHEPEGPSATEVIAKYSDIEVFTMRSYCNHDGIVLLLVTTNAVKTSHVLKVAGFQCQVNHVILIGPLNRTGWAVPLGVELAEVGIEVLQSYTSHRQRDRHYLVFKTSDDDRAIQVLTTGPAFQLLASNDTQRDQEMAIAGGFGLFQQAHSPLLN
jgi:hypothetical protein